MFEFLTIKTPLAAGVSHQIVITKMTYDWKLDYHLWTIGDWCVEFCEFEDLVSK